MARDRALYHACLLLTLVLAVVRWVTVVVGGPPLAGVERWRVFAHPLVALPLGLALVFAWRVVRKTGFVWFR